MIMDFWRISVINQLDCIKPKKGRESCPQHACMCVFVFSCACTIQTRWGPARKDVAPRRNQCSKTPQGTFN